MKVFSVNKTRIYLKIKTDFNIRYPKIHFYFIKENVAKGWVRGRTGFGAKFI